MCSSEPSRGVYSESSVMETSPSSGTGSNFTPIDVRPREAAEALEARKVGPDQHQAEVGAVTERSGPDHLIVGLGAELLDQPLDVRRHDVGIASRSPASGSSNG